MGKLNFLVAIVGFFGLLALGGADAWAVGQPEPWQMGFQEAVTPVMAQVNDLHNLLLVIIYAISGFVLALLLYVMFRFNAKSNPVPSKTTHNTLVEVVWTVIPIMILVVIAIPSFKLLYFQDKAVNAEMTIKAIGHQWYWSYEYPDHGDFSFDAVMLEDDERAEGQPRLLATDENIVVPVDTDIRVLVTADDVLHAWAVPSFGVKIDAVPGRLNETWFRAEREGIFYGQCSELCGTNHGFMPIAVKVVSKEAFAAWVAQAQEEYGDNSGASDTVTVAADPAVIQ